MYPKLDTHLINSLSKEQSVMAFDLISVPISGQTSTIQKSDLTLILKLNTREQLISFLNDCSSILNDETGFKDRLTKEFRNLMPNLTSLKLRQHNEKSYEFDLNANNKDCELVLDLGSELKNQLIAHLVKNLDMCIQYNEYVSEDMKKELIYQNNEFIQKLLSLPFGFMKREHTARNCSSAREMYKVLNEVELFHALEKENSQSKLVLVEKLINGSNSIFYNYELDIDDLLKLNPYKTIRSDVFRCNSLYVAVCLKIYEDSEQEFLSIGVSGLHDTKAEWSVKIWGRKILYRNAKYGENKQTDYSHSILNNRYNSDWTDEFISINELTNAKNHYISHKNKIKLGIELQIYNSKESRKLFKNLFK